MSENNIKDKIWWTIKARIMAEKRLLSNESHGQFILIYYSFFGTAAAIYYLVFNPTSKDVNLSWVIYSVLILCISTFLNGRNYRQRADLIKQCYIALKCLRENTHTEDEISKHYSEILETNENHTTMDYDIAILDSYLRRDAIDKKPNWYSTCRVIVYYLIRFTTLFIIYSLPIALFWVNIVCK